MALKQKLSQSASSKTASTSRCLVAPVLARANAAKLVSGVKNASAFTGNAVASRKAARMSARSSRQVSQVVYAVKNGETLDRPLRVAVIGGGPSGACTAETLAKGGCETFLIERKMDNCKV